MENPRPLVDTRFQVPVAKSNTDILKRGINNAHEAIADAMLLNPGATLRDLGALTGYTPGWISRVVNTDMFRAYWAQRRGEVSSFVAEGLPAKLEAAAHLATERIIDVLEKTEDPDLILDGFDKIMQRYGYAPKGGAHVQVNNNVFYLQREDLARARGTLIDAHSNEVAQEPPVVERENVELLK